MARGGTLMMTDGDLIVDHWAITAALDACRSGITAVNPYDRLIELSDSVSARWTAADSAGNITRLKGRQREQTGEFPPYCGGAYVIDAAFYREIGGQDERFSHWGCEDNAMSTRVLRLAPRAIQLSASTAYHLYHPRSDGRYTHPQYSRNLALLSDYTSMNDEELLSSIPGPVGDPDKYRNRERVSGARHE